MVYQHARCTEPPSHRAQNDLICPPELISETLLMAVQNGGSNTTAAASASNAALLSLQGVRALIAESGAPRARGSQQGVERRSSSSVRRAC
jgi:hypothetical protein